MQNIYAQKEPIIMGILNVTPDSFSDGDKYLHYDKSIKHAEKMIADGADIIDIGGESTRPGATGVSAQQEIDRVIPVLEKIKSWGHKVSIDTSKPEVMQAAIKAGADMINDVRALTLPGAIEVIAKNPIPVCLMHMQGQPQNMQDNPDYENVVIQVKNYLKSRIKACEQAGVHKNLISIDPGFGFGKTLQHNLDLLRGMNELVQLGFPILAGLSRKSMLGEITGNDVNDRLSASLGVALVAMQQGAKIIRVHDVKETVDIKKVFLALN